LAEDFDDFDPELGTFDDQSRCREEFGRGIVSEMQKSLRGFRGVVWVVEADEPELDQVESSCSSNNKKEDVEAQKLTDTARLES
jgi:hypothetical protein